MRFLIILALVVLACDQPFEGDYSLVRIGTRSPAAVAGDPGECFTPLSSHYRFVDGTWHHVDTMSTPQRCLDQAAPDFRQEISRPRHDSGFYRVRGDTLELHVTDKSIGVRGLVGLGFLRGDTLVFFGSDVEPGDWIFVRDH